MSEQLARKIKKHWLCAEGVRLIYERCQYTWDAGVRLIYERCQCTKAAGVRLIYECHQCTRAAGVSLIMFIIITKRGR